MSEWKNLDVSNLPPDILTGDYEFEFFNGKSKTWEKSIAKTEREKAGNIVNITGDEPWEYRYRKLQPKVPSHEEIMKPRYWQMDDRRYWRSITGYRNIDGENQYLMYEYLLYDGWCSADYFTGRQSADIPPEAEDDI